MDTLKYSWQKNDKFFVGFLNQYPQYRAQALTKEELKDRLLDLLMDIETKKIPYIKRKPLTETGVKHAKT